MGRRRAAGLSMVERARLHGGGVRRGGRNQRPLVGRTRLLILEILKLGYGGSGGYSLVGMSGSQGPYYQ